jgi:hypothetical protein
VESARERTLEGNTLLGLDQRRAHQNLILNVSRASLRIARSGEMRMELGQCTFGISPAARGYLQTKERVQALALVGLPILGQRRFGQCGNPKVKTSGVGRRFKL